MSSVKGKYLKDEGGTKISPITSIDTIYNGDLKLRQVLNFMLPQKLGSWTSPQTVYYLNCLNSDVTLYDFLLILWRIYSGDTASGKYGGCIVPSIMSGSGSGNDYNRFDIHMEWVVGTTDMNLNSTYQLNRSNPNITYIQSGPNNTSYKFVITDVYGFLDTGLVADI